MKKFIIACIFALSAVGVNAQSRTVYVCTGNGAYKYHYYKDCSGLGNCKATVKTESEGEAIKDPKYVGLCKTCAKRHAESLAQGVDDLKSQQTEKGGEYADIGIIDTCEPCRQEAMKAEANLQQ